MDALIKSRLVRPYLVSFPVCFFAFDNVICFPTLWISGFNVFLIDFGPIGRFLFDWNLVLFLMNLFVCVLFHVWINERKKFFQKRLPNLSIRTLFSSRYLILVLFLSCSQTGLLAFLPKWDGPRIDSLRPVIFALESVCGLHFFLPLLVRMRPSNDSSQLRNGSKSISRNDFSFLWVIGNWSISRRSILKREKFSILQSKPPSFCQNLSEKA